jgi:hypothetical protein
MPKKARVRFMVPAGVAVETPGLRLALGRCAGVPR